MLPCLKPPRGNQTKKAPRPQRRDDKIRVPCNDARGYGCHVARFPTSPRLAMLRHAVWFWDEPGKASPWFTLVAPGRTHPPLRPNALVPQLRTHERTAPRLDSAIIFLRTELRRCCRGCATDTLMHVLWQSIKYWRCRIDVQRPPRS